MNITFQAAKATRTGLRPSVPHSQATPESDVDLAAVRLAKYDARLARIHQRIIREAAAAAGAARLSSGYWRRRVASPKKKGFTKQPAAPSGIGGTSDKKARYDDATNPEQRPEPNPKGSLPPAAALPSIGELVAALKSRQHQQQQAESFTSVLHDMLNPATMAVDAQLNANDGVARPLPKRITKQMPSVGIQVDPIGPPSESRSSLSILPDPFVILDLNDELVANNQPTPKPTPTPSAHRRVVFISQPERDSCDSRASSVPPPSAPKINSPPQTTTSPIPVPKPKRFNKLPKPAATSTGLVEILNPDTHKPVSAPQRVIIRPIPDQPASAKQLALPEHVVKSIKHAMGVRRSFLREHFGASPRHFHQLVEEASENIFKRILTSSMHELDRTLSSMAESVFHSEFV